MESSEEEEASIAESKKRSEEEDSRPDEKMVLSNETLNKVSNSAGSQTDSGASTRVKTRFYLSGVSNHCVQVSSVSPGESRGNWTSAATSAHLTSSSCVGAEPGSRSEAFHRSFSPSVMEVSSSLATQSSRRAASSSLFRKTMDAIGWLLSGHAHLTAQVLSSAHYEEIQMCDDVTVSSLCIQMWIQTCTVNRDFLSNSSDESVSSSLNEAVAQLALSSDSAVGGASVRSILSMANQSGLRLNALSLNFKGSDCSSEKDWRGRGFDQEVNQSISFVHQEKTAISRQSEASTERVRAACVIQAAWRSFQTRRRVKSLSRAVSTSQRRYRARRRRVQEQEAVQQWEEQLRYQVCVRRQQARRRFHQKQRESSSSLPADQVRPYSEECERRAAVVIQSSWRGFRERRRFTESVRDASRDARRRQQAARTSQRAGRRSLERRRAAKVPPLSPLWIGQDGSTDARRAELKQEVEEYIATHRSTRVSAEECASSHQEVQSSSRAESQRGGESQREEHRVEASSACVHTQSESSRDAPPLPVVTAMQAESFLSPSASIAARARDSHNAASQARRSPWWRTSGEETGPAHLQESEAELGGSFVGEGGSNH